MDVSILVYRGKSCYFTKVKAKKIIKEKLSDVDGSPRAKLKEYYSVT